MSQASSNTLETGLAKLIYQNIALANIGDTGGLQPSAVPGSAFLALYTSDPTDADTGTEATYASYARIAVVRSAAGFTVSGADVSNAAIATFPTSTGTPNTITHIGTRTAITGGDLMHYGQLETPITVLTDGIVKFEIGNFKVTFQ